MTTLESIIVIGVILMSVPALAGVSVSLAKLLPEQKKESGDGSRD